MKVKDRGFRFQQSVLLAFFLALIGCGTSTSQVPDSAPIVTPLEAEASLATSTLEPLVGDGPQLTPGLVVGIITPEGQRSLGFGVADLETGRQPDGSTYFAIGSVTKIVTGLVLASAEQEGVVQTSNRVAELLNEDLGALVDPSIDLKQLATHYSGLAEFPGNLAANPDGESWSPARNYDRAQLLACFENTQCLPTSEPGTTYGYSNFGYGLLGLALQEHLGFESYSDMADARVLGPLQMTDTKTKADVDGAPRAAQGYSWKPPEGLSPVPLPEMGVLAGAGELISTADDLLSMLGAWTGIQSTDLNEAAVVAMQPLQASMAGRRVGYGVELLSMDGLEIYAKSGGTAGTTSFVAWTVEPRIGVVVLTNRGGFDASMIPTILALIVDLAALAE